MTMFLFSNDFAGRESCCQIVVDNAACLSRRMAKKQNVFSLLLMGRQCEPIKGKQQELLT